jgi:hypothetical protein
VLKRTDDCWKQSVKKNKEQRGKKKTLEKEGSSEAQGQAARSNKQRRSQLLFFLFFCLKEKDSDCTGRRAAREKGQRAQDVSVACPVRTLFLSFLFWTFLFLLFFFFFWEKSKPKQA